MFSKAKLKRFNEEVGCAPPPTQYDPRVSEKPVGGYLEKSDRWRESKDCSSGATTFLGPPIVPSHNITPRKKKALSNPRLNLSTASSASASSTSNSGFISPPQPFSRSKSVRGTRNKIDDQIELKERLRCLEEERALLRNSVVRLEEELTKLKVTENENTKKILCDSATQVELYEKKYTDQPEDLSCQKRDGETQSDNEFTTLPKEDLQILKDQIEHLTLLRNNLESSVAMKDDAIADLQMQIDLIVAEAEESHEEMQVYKEEFYKIQDEFHKTFEEKNLAEIKVKDMIAKYETLLEHQQQERKYTKDIIAQKDIEIELLNDSISSLNTQVSEYDKTINRIQSEVSLKRSQISSLELTVGDLSIATKEREFVEVMLEDEIKEKDKEYVVLETSLKQLEEKLNHVTTERDQLLAIQETDLLRIQNLEVSLKEKEVLEQFLEKEMACREAEVSESNNKLKVLEEELEKTRKVALDLQQEAETQLNEVIGLKATLSVKTFDIEHKEDLISSLKEEINLNVTSANELKEKVNTSEKVFAEIKEENIRLSAKILVLEDELTTLNPSLLKEKENNKLMEEKLVELMAEIGDRESEQKQRLSKKESEIEELSVKYSDALLDQEATKRLLTQTSELLEKETLLLQAVERELDNVREELSQKSLENINLQSSIKELTHKLIHIEDALSCEEAAAVEAQEKLKKEKEDSDNLIDGLNKEKQALQSSNEGFMSQINMLKICMTKKSMAVEEMQSRIETLRDEKNNLLDNCCKIESILNEKESMMKDLQNEFEGRLKIITDLQIDLAAKVLQITVMREEFEEKIKARETKIDNLEEEKSNILYKVSHLENHLKEEQDERCNYKIKVMELEDKVHLLEHQKCEAVQSLSTQLENEKQKSLDIATKLETLQQLYEGYEDQLNNMQTSLMDKISEVEKLERSYADANLTAVSYREKVHASEDNTNKLVLELEQLNKSLTLKDNMLTDLNETLELKCQEIDNLRKDAEDKRKSYLLNDRNFSEIKSTVEVLKKENLEATLEINELKKTLCHTKEELTLLKRSKDEEIGSRISQLIKDHEGELQEWRGVNMALRDEADDWKNKFDYLEKMIEPFREQLDSFEAERAALLSKRDADHEEVTKMSKEYAKLLGHNNHKQKIQHVIKLKTENNELKENVHKLHLELEKQKKAVRRLEEKFENNSGLSKQKNRYVKENKENSSMLAPANTSDFTQVTSTPLRSSNRYHRL